ncbi:molecular chaperone [Reticulomyxa filosa]|uniref:Molecular chaperone n=1 Tax=Reticulomyxa filosa TaxID=46433 RepID=X6NX56_RETFI|nr:molecular chaperone [Reticulomyxa filosa]|eukprot:ETO30596.1 molecular chaperone [Reticulomyxa filosa]
MDTVVSVFSESDKKKQDENVAPIEISLDISLEDLYKTTTKEVQITRNSLCPSCSDRGNIKPVECSQCNGQGLTVRMIKIGYIVKRKQEPCARCGGQGVIIRDKNKCSRCNEKRLEQITETVWICCNCELLLLLLLLCCFVFFIKIDVKIPAGSKHDDQIIIHEKGHVSTTQKTGDVIITIKCKKHKVFTRTEDDLYMNFTLSLKQALCGYMIFIPYLDGKKLLLKSELGEIVQHGEIRVIYHKGMPKKQNPTMKGNLYITFKIMFPSRNEINNELLDKITTMLPEEKKENNEIEEKKDEDQVMQHQSMMAHVISFFGYLNIRSLFLNEKMLLNRKTKNRISKFQSSKIDFLSFFCSKSDNYMKDEQE